MSLAYISTVINLTQLNCYSSLCIIFGLSIFTLPNSFNNTLSDWLISSGKFLRQKSCPPALKRGDIHLRFGLTVFALPLFVTRSLIG